MNKTSDHFFEKARNETISYHKVYYSKHQLFEEDSWLAKPDAGLINLAHDNFIARSGGVRAPLMILDLGSGVGRNAIPVAMELKKAGLAATVRCVDVLAESIEILKNNAEKYQVDGLIDGVVADNDQFQIEAGAYDLIAAISVVEHCAGKTKVIGLLRAIAAGLKPGGLVRIEITTDRNVIDLESHQAIPTFVETPLTERQVSEMLEQTFTGFEILSMEVFPYREILKKDNKQILWQSKQVSFAARAPYRD